MRLPTEEHTSRPWRLHEVVPDFEVEDVWEVPGDGDPGAFRAFVERLGSFDPTRSDSFAVRNLSAIRLVLGRIFGLDRPGSGVDGRVTSLRDRLPAELRATAPAPTAESTSPFRTLYLLDDEWAAEAANATMHGVFHLGVVADPNGSARLRLAVLVKPNGLLGRAYMAFIRPFRYLLVYPPLLRQLGRTWHELEPVPS